MNWNKLKKSISNEVRINRFSNLSDEFTVDGKKFILGGKANDDSERIYIDDKYNMIQISIGLFNNIDVEIYDSYGRDL